MYFPTKGHNHHHHRHCHHHLTQWCRTKSRSKKTYHWRFIHRSNRLCGTIQKQLTKKYGTGIFWHPGKIWHFWCFLVFLGAIFTQPCCFRVFLALHMTSTHPRHLPDTLGHHPDTARHPDPDNLPNHRHTYLL